MNDIRMNLSLEEKIGQLFVFGFDATEVDDHAIELIRKHKVGNVILFTRNVESPAQLFKLNQNLQKLAHETTGIPLFITIDQEGGMVTRIHKGATFFPGAMTLAASNNIDNALRAGRHMGEELEALGINMNLAPVLDVNNNPKNPVIGVRSFSDDPGTVSDYGNAFIKGMSERVLATAKHFPGHGDTHVDSHLALPKVDYPMDRLETIELRPFKDAINAGVGAIMSAHIDFPAITEDGLPTTLSKKCMTGLLRETLGFEGLIVTDGMQMKAIQDNYGTVEASLMAIEAGVNMVFICHARDLQIEAVAHVKKAVEKGLIAESLIDERLNRVLKAKANMAQPDLERTYEMVKATVESKTTKDFAYNVVRDAATLVKGDKLALKDNALFIGIAPEATTIADETDGEKTAIEAIRNALPALSTRTVATNPDADAIKTIKEAAKTHEQIIIQTYNANINKGQIDLVEAVSEVCEDVHVIAMRNPYDLFFTDRIKNYVCLYEYTPNAIGVLVEYLKGTCPLKGVSPVSHA